MDKERIRKVDYNPESYKTKLCTSYNMEGSCRFGDACNFAHGEKERAQQFLKLALRCDPSINECIEKVSTKKLNDSTLEDNAKMQVKVVQLENQISNLLTEIEKKDVQIAYLDSILTKITVTIPEDYKLKKDNDNENKFLKSQSFSSVLSNGI